MFTFIKTSYGFKTLPFLASFNAIKYTQNNSKHRNRRNRRKDRHCMQATRKRQLTFTKYDDWKQNKRQHGHTTTTWTSIDELPSHCQPGSEVVESLAEAKIPRDLWDELVVRAARQEWRRPTA